MFDSCLRLSLLTAPVSPSRLRGLCVAKPPRPACIYVQRSRVLFIWPLLGCLRRDHPLSPSVRPAASSCAASCEVLRQRRVFTSLRSHNSGRQTGKPFFLPLSFSFPSSFSCSCFYSGHRRRFPRVLHSSTFLAISVKYFKDRLPPSFRSLVRRLRFWG